MCLRHDREVARLAKAWKLLCRMASFFREEDVRERAGRKSWRSPGRVLAARPYLKADVLTNNIAGVKRG